MLVTCQGPVAVTTLSQNTITVTFEDPVMFSTSILGDYFVEPCTVESVSPAWTGSTNGAMKNPNPASNEQGYDSRSSPAMNFTFNAALRATFPLTLVDGDRLVLTKGKTSPDTGGGATHVSDCMILTCKSSLPTPGAVFRPSFCDSTSTVYSDPDYDLLPGLATPSGCTLIDMSVSSMYLNKPYLMHGHRQTSWAQIIPSNHGSASGYPYDLSWQIGQMALACMLDIPQAQSIANRIIQHGIDLFPQLAVNTDTFARQAGFGHGKKWPILFAKLMLGQSWTIPYYVSGSSGEEKFMEDSHTYLGASSTPRLGEVCSTAGYDGTYAISNHVCRHPSGALDQWEMHYLEGQPNGPGGLYEYGQVARAWVGPALAARLMETSAGAMTAWGNATFFAYVDRWIDDIADNLAAFTVPLYNNATTGLPYTNAGGHPEGSDLSTTSNINKNKYGGPGSDLFMKRMWETYR